MNAAQERFAVVLPYQTNTDTRFNGVLREFFAPALGSSQTPKTPMLRQTGNREKCSAVVMVDGVKHWAGRNPTFTVRVQCERW